MPIATSLCPDEVDHHADDPEDDADADADGGDADDEDILPWSSSVYFLVHFPQKQDINQLKWQAMKFVERGGTTRRNSGRCIFSKSLCQSFLLPHHEKLTRNNKEQPGTTKNNEERKETTRNNKEKGETTRNN